MKSCSIVEIILVTFRPEPSHQRGVEREWGGVGEEWGRGRVEEKVGLGGKGWRRERMEERNGGEGEGENGGGGEGVDGKSTGITAELSS